MTTVQDNHSYQSLVKVSGLLFFVVALRRFEVVCFLYKTARVLRGFKGFKIISQQSVLRYSG